jgi:hypothetical protein
VVKVGYVGFWQKNDLGSTRDVRRLIAGYSQFVVGDFLWWFGAKALFLFCGALRKMRITAC